jgi:hypothetical protein
MILVLSLALNVVICGIALNVSKQRYNQKSCIGQ